VQIYLSEITSEWHLCSACQIRFWLCILHYPLFLPRALWSWVYVFSHHSLCKLQSGICGQLLCSLIIGEEEGEKMTKVHDYPKGEKSLQSSMSVVRWKDVELFLLTLAICRLVNCYVRQPFRLCSITDFSISWDAIIRELV